MIGHPIEDSWVKKGIIQDKVEKEGLEMNEDTLVSPPQPHTPAHTVNTITFAPQRHSVAPSPPRELVEYWFQRDFQSASEDV